MLDDDLAKLLQCANMHHHNKRKMRTCLLQRIPVALMLIVGIIDLLERIFGFEIETVSGISGRKTTVPAFITDQF